MSGQDLEIFLARVYTDPELCARFLADPYAEAARAGLSEEHCRALRNIDRIGVQMAARSFAKKRDLKRRAQH